MKNILFYSPDFSLCYSLLMYLQDTYNVTTTTDLEVLKNILNYGFDLVLMDAEPSNEVNNLCGLIHSKYNIPVILTYVFKNSIKDYEQAIRQHVSSIFYKPYDLSEVTNTLSTLMI